jgi:hypothetical protein
VDGDWGAHWYATRRNMRGTWVKDCDCECLTKPDSARCVCIFCKIKNKPMALSGHVKENTFKNLILAHFSEFIPGFSGVIRRSRRRRDSSGDFENLQICRAQSSRGAHRVGFAYVYS